MPSRIAYANACVRNHALVTSARISLFGVSAEPSQARMARRREDQRSLPSCRDPVRAEAADVRPRATMDRMSCESRLMMASWCEKAILAAQIRQSRRRIGDANDLMERSRSAIERSRAAIRSSHTQIAAPTRATASATPTSAARTLLADLSADALDAIVDDFSAAYLEAEATGNDETAEIVRQALVVLGRHLAHELGPKAAGVQIN
ncbi:hypothetical protein FV226_19210 [Methylobacterium sp. WL12]|uniref:hypothetical protein n=1 Tax=Methylobacterium sp. WL103 TaxID=2603891 RepID=UPI0011CCC09C|nr:hypothetical protein [Methylobacterium sp. WL103]TXM68942.1 hypothetical protein FV226_19210 [Methylobacterium sp. WL12]